MPNLDGYQQYADLVDAAEDRYAIPRGLGAGLIDHETTVRGTSSGSWDAHAIRQEPQIGDASRGLTQILLRTARGLGYTGTAAGLFDPGTNIDLGFKYLASMFRSTGSWPAALSAYNGGLRPTLGFGAILTAPRQVVIAHDPVTGQVSQTRTAQPGEFANQPYVDDVLERAAGFGYDPSSGLQALVSPPDHLAPDGSSPSGLGWLILALLGAGGLVWWATR